jgi:ABC-type nitrate/sulfonate/bicarbonate transport system substrate-binding protein
MIRLALDWTPNPIHCGIFVAVAKNLFIQSGIELEIISPSKDNYTLTPAEKLRQGLCDLAIIPPEEIIKDQLEGKNILKPLKAVLQSNGSAMAVLSSSNITRPAMLDGKRYALLEIPWEREVITAMVINDGGKGDIEFITAPKLETYDMLFDGKADCVWLFEPIEGTEASYSNIQLNTFKLEKYGVPYGPTTILTSTTEAFDRNSDEIIKTLDIIALGYEMAFLTPAIGTQAIYNHPLNTYYETYDLLHDCQKAVKPYLTENGKWGNLDLAKLDNYSNWIKKVAKFQESFFTII